MMVLRGHRADQAKWGPGWTWEDVEPAYIKSESAFPRADLRDRHELTLAFVNAAVAAGLERRDLNGPDTEGVGFVPVSQRRGRRITQPPGAHTTRPSLSTTAVPRGSLAQYHLPSASA